MPKWAKVLIGIVAVVAVLGIGFLIYFNVSFISKDEVKENIARHINVDEDDLYFENVDLELDNNQYEVDFYYNNNEYEAKVDAKEGKVIFTNYPIELTSQPSTTNDDATTNDDNTTNDTTTTKEITLEEAKDIALKHGNLNESNLTLVKEREERDDGINKYEIEWRDNTYEYDFEISKTGEVLHYDKDRIND